MNSDGFCKTAAVKPHAYRFTKTPAIHAFFLGVS